jgi:hypothetical protein
MQLSVPECLLYSNLVSDLLHIHRLQIKGLKMCRPFFVIPINPGIRLRPVTVKFNAISFVSPVFKIPNLFC